MSEYEKLLNSCNLAIADAAMKCEAVFSGHDKAFVGISGGADSDIVIDICERVRKEQPIELKYSFYNTGIEYDATKRHLDYLEQRYDVKIQRLRALESVPVCCHKYGQPFASKYISMMIQRLQKIGFDWDGSDSYDELWEKYGKCRSGLRWWTNDFGNTGRPCKFDIGYRRHLKEFMTENPPWFRISPKCCEYAKKRTAERSIRESGCDLSVIGIRKSEGGARAIQNKCFDRGAHGEIDTYRPIFWFTDADRIAYEELFGIVHSDCYTKWGFKRTGCVGCPFSRNLESDMETTEQFEPRIHKAACKVFADSYEYTRMFNEFKTQRKGKSRQMKLKM